MDPWDIDPWEHVDFDADPGSEVDTVALGNVLRAVEALTSKITALRATVTDAAPSARAMGAPTALLTAQEAARHIRLSPKALYQRVARGQLKAYRLGRALRFRRADLDALMRPLAP
jgi:excisionase family DNA binding protein